MNREELRKILRDDVDRLRAESKITSRRLDAIMSDCPSGLPHPDGAQRVRNASVESAASRARLMHAIRREAAFMLKGIVPEDLARRRK